jgi:hypothetical protein
MPGTGTEEDLETFLRTGGSSFQPQLQDYTAIPIPHVSASSVQVPAVPYPSVQQGTWQARGLKAEIVPLQMDVRDDTIWFWMRSETSF